MAKKYVNVWVTRELKEKIEDQRRRKGMSISNYVELAILNYMSGSVELPK